MNNDNRPSREPPWSIPYGWRVAYVLTFAVKMIAYTLIVARQEIASGGHRNAIDITIAVIERDSTVTPGIGASTIILMEGVSYLVITYNYLHNKFVQPLIDKREAEIERRLAESVAEGLAEGLAEGKARGMAEGKAEMHLRWADWNSRRLEAESKGIPFDEPPPSEEIS